MDEISRRLYLNMLNKSKQELLDKISTRINKHNCRVSRIINNGFITVYALVVLCIIRLVVTMMYSGILGGFYGVLLHILSIILIFLATCRYQSCKVVKDEMYDEVNGYYDLAVNCFKREAKKSISGEKENAYIDRLCKLHTKANSILLIEYEKMVSNLSITLIKAHVLACFLIILAGCSMILSFII